MGLFAYDEDQMQADLDAVADEGEDDEDYEDEDDEEDYFDEDDEEDYSEDEDYEDSDTPSGIVW